LRNFSEVGAKGTENTQLSQNKHSKPINLGEIAKTRRKKFFKLKPISRTEPDNSIFHSSLIRPLSSSQASLRTLADGPRFAPPQDLRWNTS
jgi:hypothetical protein